ncbi:MAG TPA: alpha-mannosidase 2c1, partial [Bacteroidetes bacterium]|nr:alpha-mannosidase 2c1 [Bacteroidota bacterium]
HRNTSWDLAKFEVVGHRFADLSDRDYGAALLNDSKYGYKILDNVLDLNLLRATTMPDPNADRGRHQFTYSFLPHKNELIDAPVLSEAAQLNQPPAIFPGYAGANLSFPFSLNSDAVVLEVIKKAEKEDAAILRFYEPYGKKASVQLKINREHVAVFKTDLMENNLQLLNVSNGLVTLDFSPFEIKTLKVVE